jgi:hypothetical protein
MLLVETLLLFACLTLAYRQTVPRQLAGAVLMAVAAISYFGGALLRAAGDGLQHVELPAYFDTTTIMLPDGRRFAFIASLQRVQRYGSDGVFERGWFVNGPAIVPSGGLSLGLTAADRVVIASKRTGFAEIYSADGFRDGGTQPYRRIGSGAGMPPLMLPGSFAVEGVTLVPPVRVSNPRLGWTTILPGLFLHSWAAGAWFWAALNLLLSAKMTARAVPPPKSPAPLPFQKPVWRHDAAAHDLEQHDPEEQVSAWAMGGALALMFATILITVLLFIVVIAVPTVGLVAG